MTAKVVVMKSKMASASGASARGATEAFPETKDIGRDVGIPAIGRAPWGTHFCQFYDTKQDLLDILVPFIRAGLDNNELCVWVTSAPLGADEAAEALSQQMPDFERKAALGQISIFPYDAWYKDPEIRDPQQYIEPLVASIADALARGYSGQRGTGNASWVDIRNWTPFMAYEAAFGRRFADQRTIGLCTYPLDMCDSSRMIDVLMRHKYALIKQDGWNLIEPSQQKRATAAVERMNIALAERTAELQAALADLRGFSRWVAHDLRAPLRSVRGFSDLLAESITPKMNDEERHLFECVQAGADRMDTLITDILAFTTAQQNAPRLQVLDLQALTRETWEMLTGSLGVRAMRLQIQPMPQAHGDPAMIRQVLGNLLANTIKFTSKTPAPYVEVGSQTVNGQCVYYVRDNGVGFDATHAERIFGTFERLHGKAEFEGTGLGLAIVKQIVTRHGGQVWAEGNPGTGATFHFTLPAPIPDTSTDRVPKAGLEDRP